MTAQASSDRITLVNVPDLNPAHDDFTKMDTAVPVDWVRLSGLPANALERNVRGIRLSRYRAAHQAARAAQAGGVVISHLPLMTAAVSGALALRRSRAAHLGFAFNFTRLPTGARLAYMRSALRRVDQLTIFSHHEQSLYADLFDMDPARFAPVIWTQDAPPVDAQPSLDIAGPYVCAVGGEGRDFALLIEVAKRIAPARMVIVARPHSLAGLSIPDNVTVLTNIPPGRLWRIAKDSAGVLVPLLSETTCCGHITLVSAKLLGLPIATTRAHATREYVAGRAAVLECDPGDATAFATLTERMLDEADMLGPTAREAMAAERDFHDRRHWADHVDDFIRAKGSG